MTSLFADLVGLTARAEQLDPEDVAAAAGPYHARLRDELERYGGTVEKFIGDAVMAVFGAPVAHEDDPERAVRAALAIRAIRGSTSDRRDLQVRIARQHGRGARRTRRAPRGGRGRWSPATSSTPLRACSPPRRSNGILVGEATLPRDASARSSTARPSPSRRRARREPVPVWEALAAARAPRRRPRLAPAARRSSAASASSTLLARRARAAPRGARAAARHARRRARDRQEPARLRALQLVDADPELIRWRQGRSLPYGEGVSSGRSARSSRRRPGSSRRTPPTRPRRSSRAVLEDCVDEASAGWVERHLRPLVGLGAPRRLATEPRRGVRGLAPVPRGARPSSGRLVLVFEDLHWADDGAARLRRRPRRLGRRACRCCRRAPRGPSCSTRRPGWGGGKPNAITLSLSPLDGRRDRAARRARCSSGRCSPADDPGGAARTCGRQPALRRGVRPHAPVAGVGTSASCRCPRRCRASSQPASTRCPPREGAAPGRRGRRQGLLVRRARRARRHRAAASSRSCCTRSSARSSSAESAAPRSPARRSTPFATRSCATSPTARSRARRAPSSTARRRVDRVARGDGRRPRRAARPPLPHRLELRAGVRVRTSALAPRAIRALREAGGRALALGAYRDRGPFLEGALELIRRATSPGRSSSSTPGGCSASRTALRRAGAGRRGVRARRRPRARRRDDCRSAWRGIRSRGSPADGSSAPRPSSRTAAFAGDGVRPGRARAAGDGQLPV